MFDNLCALYNGKHYSKSEQHPNQQISGVHFEGMTSQQHQMEYFLHQDEDFRFATLERVITYFQTHSISSTALVATELVATDTSASEVPPALLPLPISPCDLEQQLYHELRSGEEIKTEQTNLPKLIAIPSLAVEPERNYELQCAEALVFMATARCPSQEVSAPPTPESASQPTESPKHSSDLHPACYPYTKPFFVAPKPWWPKELLHMRGTPALHISLLADSTLTQPTVVLIFTMLVGLSF